MTAQKPDVVGVLRGSLPAVPWGCVDHLKEGAEPARGRGCGEGRARLLGLQFRPPRCPLPLPGGARAVGRTRPGRVPPFRGTLLSASYSQAVQEAGGTRGFQSWVRGQGAKGQRQRLRALRVPTQQTTHLPASCSIKIVQSRVLSCLHPSSWPPSRPQGPTYWLGGQGTPFWGGLGLQMGDGPWVLDLDGEGRTHSWQASNQEPSRQKRGPGGGCQGTCGSLCTGAGAWHARALGAARGNGSLGPGRKHTDKDTVTSSPQGARKSLPELEASGRTHS